MIGFNKEKGSTAAAGDQSWRALAGSSRARVNSPKAKKRRLLKWFRLLAILAVVGLVVTGLIAALNYLKNTDKVLQVKTPSQPVERVLFYSDGVLPSTWVGSVIELPAGISMMEVDIFALKEKIESQGQIKSASIERVFPGDLKITVQEHSPVLRLVTENGSGKKTVRIVARDGSVYTGIGYKQNTLHRLPYVLPYRHVDGSYFPIRGIDRVADLLEYARNNSPEIVATWQVIALNHYSGDIDLPGQVIEVRSKLVPKIIFSANGDYGTQLDRLKYILHYIRQRGNQSIERIDLSLRGSAAVQFSSGRISTY